MMIQAGYIALQTICFIVFNRLRGSGKGSKITYYSLMAGFMSLSLWLFFPAGFEYWHPPILFALTWLGFSFGWGKYFPHGQNYIGEAVIFKEYEEPIGEWVADTLVGKWYGFEPDSSWVVKWQVAAMMGRFCWFAPLFGYLTYVYMNPLFLLSMALFPVSAAFSYWVGFLKWSDNSVRNSEFLVGFFFGLATGLPTLSTWLI